jgi:hypothetical protein
MWLGLFVLACAATVQRAPAAADRLAKAFAPEPGHANVYIYRPQQFSLSSQAYTVKINGNAFGSTGAGTFLLADLPAPGTYTIESESELPAPVILRVEPRHNYFFRQDVSSGAGFGRSFLQPVDDTTGRDGVNATQLLMTHPVVVASPVCSAAPSAAPTASAAPTETPKPCPVPEAAPEPACPPAPASASTRIESPPLVGGCKKDTDCKGTRVCDGGRCVGGDYGY